MKSAFMEKEPAPQPGDLAAVLGAVYGLWQALVDYVHARCPEAADAWGWSKSGGWNLAVKDRRRAIVYLLPRAGFFKAALVFGERAAEAVMASGVSDAVKAELAAARPYAEGRGIRIEVRDNAAADEIKALIDIKLAH